MRKTHTASVKWECKGDFARSQYSRAHTWHFDGGLTVPASSSPHHVELPWSDPANIDPEEAYVVALASCHMLWFLSLAAKRGLEIERYTDNAEGKMGMNEHGKACVSHVVLRPHVLFRQTARTLTKQDLDTLHHAAHDECFIANSVTTNIDMRATWQILGDDEIFGEVPGTLY